MPYHKGKKKGSTDHDHTTSKAKVKDLTTTTTTDRAKEVTTKERAKAKDQRASQHSTTSHHLNRPKERDQQMEKAPTSYATTADNRATLQTNAGGKDLSTTLIQPQQYGQYQTTHKCNVNNCLNNNYHLIRLNDDYASTTNYEST
eukprot:4484033-Amphidinium_carterae.1